MRRMLFCFFVVALCAAAGIAKDDEKSKADRERGEKSTEVAVADRTAQPRIYIPPARGATRTRTGGGTRSISHLPKLVALVPDHVGQTLRPAPELSWFVAGAAEAPLVLTLAREDAVEPELEVTLADHVAAGIGRVSLARFAIELEAGVVYRWSVALIADPEERERDVIARGAIVRVPEPAGLGAPSDYRALAANGLWYDALAALGGAIDGGDTGLRASRAQLLDEVGLTSAAAFERAVP